MRSTFISIIKQLNQIYRIKTNQDIKFKLKTNQEEFFHELSFNEIKNLLKDYLYQLSHDYPDHRIYMFIDSIEQLENFDFNRSSLFVDLPSNTKVVYSVQSNFGNLLATLELKIKLTRNFLEIKPLDLEEAQRIIEKKLIIHDKDLTQKQKRLLKKVLKKVENLNQLYLSLVYDIISRWYSFDEDDVFITNAFQKCTNTNKCIHYIFQILETHHGELFVKNCLFYINQFTHSGISEQELCGIMTLDDDLVQETFGSHLPKVIQFPFLKWKQLEHYIKNYIWVKNEFDLDLIRFSHIKFSQVISSRTEANNNLFNIYHFFKETYRKRKHEKNSLFVVNQNTSCLGTTRVTMSQRVFVFLTTKKLQKWLINKRKLFEFPKLIMKFAEISLDFMIDELKRSLFFNLKFLYSIILLKEMSFLSDLKQDLVNLFLKLGEPVESILVLFLILIENFDLFCEQPNNFLFNLRSRLIDYCLIKQDSALLNLLDEQTAFYFNKQLMNENLLELKITQIVPAHTMLESQIRSLHDDNLFRDKFWIKLNRHKDLPIIFHLHQKHMQIEVYNYKTGVLLDEICIKMLVKDNFLCPEIMFKTQPDITPNLVLNNNFDAYLFSHSDDILFVHDMRKLQPQFIDLTQHKKYYVYPSNYIVVVRQNEISLFDLAKTDCSIKNIRFEFDIINTELNLNYSNYILPGLFLSHNVDLILVVLFNDEIKLIKLDELTMEIVLTIPIEIEITEEFFIKYERNYVLNDLDTKSSSSNVYLKFLLAKKNENHFNDDLYMFEIYSDNDAASSNSLSDVDEFEYKMGTFKFEFKDILAYYEGFIFAVDAFNNLIIFNTGNIIYKIGNNLNLLVYFKNKDSERISKLSSPLDNLTTINFISVKYFVLTDVTQKLSVLIRFDDDYDEELLFAYSTLINGSVLFVQSREILNDFFVLRF